MIDSIILKSFENACFIVDYKRNNQLSNALITSANLSTFYHLGFTLLLDI